ncbi:hypothetical protein Leryth_013457 [Lithospermum erythrorhizon]|nr:hypothetical protein Leryth_013457 [Lithospermum erythrorhizon]
MYFAERKSDNKGGLICCAHFIIRQCTDRLYLVLLLLYVHEMGSELIPPTVIVLKRLVLNVVQLAATLSRKP